MEHLNALAVRERGFRQCIHHAVYYHAVNLLELNEIQTVMGQISGEVTPDASLKEKAAIAVRLFEGTAEKRGISLRLRKKPKM